MCTEGVLSVGELCVCRRVWEGKNTGGDIVCRSCLYSLTDNPALGFSFSFARLLSPVSSREDLLASQQTRCIAALEHSSSRPKNAVAHWKPRGTGTDRELRVWRSISAGEAEAVFRRLIQAAFQCSTAVGSASAYERESEDGFLTIGEYGHCVTNR